MDSSVPDVRIRLCNDRPVRPAGAFVLYWMIAARRTHYNFSLERAVDWTRELGKPLVVLEALRCDYTWASARLHRFVLDGMAAQARRFARTPARYYPYVEPEFGAGKGLLAALAQQACVVVTDDFPGFFLPRMVASASAQVPVALEQVDSNGLYPIAATERVFVTAASFRRHLQKDLPAHLGRFPRANPLTRLPERPARVAKAILRRWPPAGEKLLSGGGLATLPIDLPIDHSVAPTRLQGGAEAARAACRSFVQHKLPQYLDARNQPETEATSRLSAYLHFGHIAAHDIFLQLAKRDGWTPDRLAAKATGSREGWWGASPEVEAFFDQLITWREIGYNMAAKRRDYDRYESLPAWAQTTLDDHRADVREYTYSLAQFEAARTHDPLWNAAQRQLVREGCIHNYLRMLWGKKIIEWTKSPQSALAVMIELNNKYGLDGRNPNSYSGIFWCLGRYDRPWGPERPIFGKVRFMSSANTARKVKVANYICTYAEELTPRTGDGL